ncbi:hypothetical protein BST81_12845 [Leptolyngbya sp. 'hensonii']|nr:hypothetical protein BST81_12845 [Leptolyngbya sp. 'hensonii']
MGLGAALILSSPALAQDVRSTATPVPEVLNPNANPLQFPTRSEEVQIKVNEPITLQQAFELARRHNRALQVTELQLRASQSALQAARASENPTVTFQSNLSYSDSAQGEFSVRQQQNSTLTSLANSQNNQNTISAPLTGTLEVSYPLYTSGRTTANIQAAERQVRYNELQYELQAEQLRLDVSTDYYALQQADEQVRISRASVRNAAISLRDAEARERAGVGTRFDVLQSQVQLANAQQTLTSALSQQQIARRQLAQRLSLSQSANITAADAIEVVGLWDLSLENSIVLAFKNRAELEQQLVQREINERQRAAILAALGPQLNVFANYNVYTDFDARPNPGLADGYSVGARLSWSLYDGGVAQAQADQQTRNMEIAEVRFADTRNQVRFQVEQAYYQLQSNFANIQTAALALEQATEALRLARLRFQAGVGTQTDVINAETALTQAESNRLQAIISYNRALASLQRAISNFSTPLGST